MIQSKCERRKFHTLRNRRVQYLSTSTMNLMVRYTPFLDKAKQRSDNVAADMGITVSRKHTHTACLVLRFSVSPSASCEETSGQVSVRQTPDAGLCPCSNTMWSPFASHTLLTHAHSHVHSSYPLYSLSHAHSNSSYPLYSLSHAHSSYPLYSLSHSSSSYPLYSLTCAHFPPGGRLSSSPTAKASAYRGRGGEEAPPEQDGWPEDEYQGPQVCTCIHTQCLPQRMSALVTCVVELSTFVWWCLYCCIILGYMCVCVAHNFAGNCSFC